MLEGRGGLLLLRFLGFDGGYYLFLKNDDLEEEVIVRVFGVWGVIGI